MELTMHYVDRLPQIGDILGSRGSRDMIDSLNQELGSAAFFGSSNDPFKSQHNFFIERVIQPMRLAAAQFSNIFSEVRQREDNYSIRAIDSLEMLERGIPTSMVLPIAHHPFIRELATHGRIDNFGIDPELLPTENPYQRLIDNGTADIDPTKDTYVLNYHWESTDPNLSIDEIEMIKDTYDFIDLFYSDLDNIYKTVGKSLSDKSYLQGDNLRIKDIDITDFPRLKG